MYMQYTVHRWGICMAPHTPSTKAIDVPVGSANGIQGARHICLYVYACMHAWMMKYNNYQAQFPSLN